MLLLGYNSFEKRLEDTVECNERQKMECMVKLRDVTAPVQFYIDKFPVDTSDGRIEVVNRGEGEHVLIIHKVSEKYCRPCFT